MKERFFEYKERDSFVGKTRIIYGCFQEAREFAVRLLNEDIPFDMFLFPEENEDYYMPHIWGKPVIDITQCKNLDNTIIMVSFWEYEEAKKRLASYGLVHLLNKIEDLPDIIKKSKNVVVYGTGGRAERFYKDFRNFFSIKYFCDSNEKKAGDIFLDRQIIKPSDLRICQDETVVIIASTYISEIYSVLLDNGISEDFIYTVSYESDFRLQKEGLDCSNLKIKEDNLHGLHTIVRDIKDSQVILYGYQDIVKMMLPKLKILGISPVQVLERAALEEDGTVYNLSFYDYKNAIILLLDPYSDEVYTALAEMEIEEKKMIWMWNHTSFYVSNKQKQYKFAIDPNCGYAYLGKDEEYPGFIKYQYTNKESNQRVIRILTLGGSTTSGYGTKNSSWSEKLSLLLKEYGISHVLYCGGVDGYSASNELVKFIRDGIWLKPDLVINYTGCNNENRYKYRCGNPFLNTYQERLFENLLGKVSQDFTEEVGEVHYGIQPKANDYEYWYTQMKALHAVCSSLGIRHKVFLQPILFTKKHYYESDADIAILCNSFFRKGLDEYVTVDAPLHYCSLLHNAKVFEEMVKASEDLWLESLTDIFDDEEGLYMDYAHVYEKGNQIIADNILKKIIGEIRLILEERT